MLLSDMHWTPDILLNLSGGKDRHVHFCCSRQKIIIPPLFATYPYRKLQHLLITEQPKTREKLYFHYLFPLFFKSLTGCFTWALLWSHCVGKVCLCVCPPHTHIYTHTNTFSPAPGISRDGLYDDKTWVVFTQASHSFTAQDQCILSACSLNIRLFLYSQYFGRLEMLQFPPNGLFFFLEDNLWTYVWVWNKVKLNRALAPESWGWEAVREAAVLKGLYERVKKSKSIGRYILQTFFRASPLKNTHSTRVRMQQEHISRIYGERVGMWMMFQKSWWMQKWKKTTRIQIFQDDKKMRCQLGKDKEIQEL